MHNINTYPYPILDPDYSYHTHIPKEKLYCFFKSLSKPHHIDFMSSIFIEFEVFPYSFHKHPHFYHHISDKLIEKLHTFLDYTDFNIFCHHNLFYLTLFNVDENQLNQSLCNFHQYLQQHSFQYHNRECHFVLKCGIYHSHNFIDPYQFYQCAYNQYLNLHHPDSFISVQKIY